MPICDVCSVEVGKSEGSIVKPEVFRSMVRNGYRPPTQYLQQLTSGLGSGDDRWKQMAMASDTDWLLCKECNQTAEKFLTGQAATTRKAVALSVPDNILGMHDGVVCLVMSENGRYAVSASQTTAKLWDCTRGEIATVALSFTVQMPSAEFFAVANDGGTFMGAHTDHAAGVWNANGKLLHKLDAPGFVNAVARSSNLALIGHGYGVLTLWDVNSGHRLRKFGGMFSPKQETRQNSIALSADQRRAVSSAYDSLLYWDATSGKAIGKVIPRRCSMVRLSTDGARMTCLEEQALTTYDAASGQRIASVETGKRLAVGSLSADGSVLIATVWDHDAFRSFVRIWDLRTGKSRAPFDSPSEFSVDALAIASDGKRLLLADNGGFVRRIDLGS